MSVQTIATRVAIRGTTLGAIILLAILAAFAQPVTAAQAPTTTRAQMAAASANCHYQVTGNDVHVRRNPNTFSDIVKVKNRGDHVNGPALLGRCWLHVWNHGRWWTNVHLASGTSGWIAAEYLYYRGYW